MSRSLRKNLITGITTSESEKKDKRRWNKIFRHESKVCILRGAEPPKRLKEVCNVWSGAKDGRSANFL